MSNEKENFIKHFFLGKRVGVPGQQAALDTPPEMEEELPQIHNLPHPLDVPLATDLSLSQVADAEGEGVRWAIQRIVLLTLSMLDEKYSVLTTDTDIKKRFYFATIFRPLY